MERVVIVGAGQAGLQIAASLRQEGHDGPIALIGAEPAPPYQRPPLSKAYLQGALDADRLDLRPREFYEKSGIDLWLSTRVAAIDRRSKAVELADGTRLAYDRLALATGAPPRRLAIAGAELSGVYYLRTLADSDALRPALAAKDPIAVIGAGYIGLEVAASARKAGCEVVVIEALDRPLARVAGPEVAAWFVDLHRAQGVGFRFGARIAEIRGHGRVEAVALASGEEIPCAAVLVGIGAEPQTALAAAAGLAIDNGVAVDERAATEDPAIFAAGDCASFPSRLFGRRIRLESQPNAIDQGKVAALAMLGAPARYDPTPWFWSDQYDVKLQSAGLAAGADEVAIRIGPGGQRSVWSFLGGRLIAVDALNDAAAFAVGRRLIAASARPDPKRLADPAADLKSLVS